MKKKKLLSIQSKCPHGCDDDHSEREQGLLFLDEALSCFMATNAKIPDDLAEVLADGTYALIRLAELAMDDEE